MAGLKIGSVDGELTWTIRHELTLASLEALRPRVAKVGVTGLSALVEPGTAARATCEPAGFASYTLRAYNCRSCNA